MFSFVVCLSLLKVNKCAFNSTGEQIACRIFRLDNKMRRKKTFTIGFIFVTALDYYAKSG